MRVVALAASMEHQVEAGDNTEAIACERAKPSHPVRAHRKSSGCGIGREDLIWRERPHALLGGLDPACRIGEETHPAEVDQGRSDRGDLPVDQRYRLISIEENIRPLEIAVYASDLWSRRDARAQALAQFRAARDHRRIERRAIDQVI